MDKYVVAACYSRRTSRDWLYYEIVPLLAFEKEYGYKVNPGIRLRLEFFFGNRVIDEAWRLEAEDDEDFRW